MRYAIGSLSTNIMKMSSQALSDMATESRRLCKASPGRVDDIGEGLVPAQPDLDHGVVTVVIVLTPPSPSASPRSLRKTSIRKITRMVPQTISAVLFRSAQAFIRFPRSS
jgi:hypothetical protein